MNRLRRLWSVFWFFGCGAGALAGAELAWVDLLTSGTPAELAPFYEKTLGWTSKREGEGALGAVVFSRGGYPVAGAVHRASERRGEWRSRWVGFFGVADLRAAEAKTNASGGRVIEAAHAGAASTVFGASQLLATDAEGAVVGFVTAGPEGKGMEGARGFWPVLLSRRPTEAGAFYRELLGGGVREDMRTPLFPGDFLLTEDDRPWAGVQPNGVGGRAGWMILMAVADIDAATAAARRAGGRVLREPAIDLIGGRVAVLADPVGGVFGLYEALPLGPGAKARRAAPAASQFEVEALR